MKLELFIALLPALIMITLVIITRKVLISLGVGVLLAAFIYSSYNPFRAVIYIAESFFSIVTDIYWYLPILGFVVIIGGITAVITISGGVQSFANWSVSKVKNPIAAQLLTWILGIIIMIDDYFNALVIGEVSKPITDQYGVSRAKLSYIIDSTSAPVVILMPISTWGAYIIGLLGKNFVDASYDVRSGFAGFIAAIPFQFYPITALIMVFLVIRFGIKFGPMKKFEDSAEAGNDISKLETEDALVVIEGKKASQWTLILPILLLVFMTFFMMLYSAGFNLSAIMDQEITIPLFVGGLFAFILSVILAIFKHKVKPISVYRVSSKGMFSMLKSAAAILILAWMVSNAIQDLETGDMIAVVVSNSNIAHALLPLILFLIAGAIAFATGTSWGSFGILLPIAIPIAMSTDPLFMPAIVAAVLGGAVFGDHSSPVSDTTVLSATGARSTLHSHFISQLPYALFAALFAALGYLLYGLTEILILSYLLIAVLLFLFVKVYKMLNK
jgi:tetracycline resistance efflux pump